MNTSSTDMSTSVLPEDATCPSTLLAETQDDSARAVLTALSDASQLARRSILQDDDGPQLSSFNKARMSRIKSTPKSRQRPAAKMRPRLSDSLLQSQWAFEVGYKLEHGQEPAQAGKSPVLPEQSTSASTGIEPSTSSLPANIGVHDDSRLSSGTGWHLLARSTFEGKSAGWQRAYNYLSGLTAIDNPRSQSTEQDFASVAEPVRTSTSATCSLEGKMASLGAEDRFTNRFKVHTSSKSEIYSAFDPDAREPVTIKVYERGRLNDELFRRACLEASILSAVHHPNIVSLRQHFLKEDKLLLVMEDCTHGNLLREWELFRQQWSESAIFNKIIKPLLHAVAALHQHGYIHCAITPAHIMLRRDGTICLLDLFHAIDTNIEGNHARRGYLDYMPPEMVMLPTLEELRSTEDPVAQPARLGTSVDVWQIGCLTYELLNGRAPFEFQSIESTAVSIVYGHITSFCEGVSTKARRFVTSCLNKDPLERPSIQDLLNQPVFTGGFTTLASAVNVLHKLQAQHKSAGSLAPSVAASRLRKVKSVNKKATREAYKDLYGKDKPATSLWDKFQKTLEG